LLTNTFAPFLRRRKGVFSEIASMKMDESWPLEE